ncbi:MAG: hypothetical protein KatS3mg076_1271 [Candidatus Binatia bacterium]|nr:MAG: hypothetical protein KatS3mg076_1271 [Candidatus Binatia bacterium]
MDRPRRDEAAWRYHELTKHSWERIRRHPHVLDWENMPRPFKRYVGLESLPLPRDLPPSKQPALVSLREAGEPAPLELPLLAKILLFSAGVLRRKRYAGGEIAFRAAACTGALYHVELYVVSGDLPGLPAGVYHFAPDTFSLERLRSGDFRRFVLEATADAPAVRDAPLVLALTSTFWRNAWKYRERAYRHAFWDSGTILANLLGVANASGVPAKLVLGFVDRELDRLIGVDGEREATLVLVALGTGAELPPSAPEVPPLSVPTLPYSEKEVDYPLIRETHRATCLESPGEVRAWRECAFAPRRSRSESPPAPGVRLPRLSAPPGDPIEAVVRKRGSTRVFARVPVASEIFGEVLASCPVPIPTDLGDAGVLSDRYVLALGVDGIEPGAYAFDPDSGELRLLRPGRFRAEGRSLALGQALGGDGAFDLYWLADLRAVLGRHGNRGYRAAQLAAAIEGGRAYLASFALGIGATGLTFFDDDVSAFFGVPQKAVLFLTAHGHPASRRKRAVP